MYQVFWSGLSDDVSVVAINGPENGTVAQWQRPIAGVAVFVVTATAGDDLLLTAYNSDGQELATSTQATTEQ